MLRQMTYREWKSWIAYSQLHPFPSDRIDWLAASIVWAVFTSVGHLETTVGNMFSTSKRQPKKWDIKDLLITFGEPAPPTRRQTAKQQWSAISRMASMLAGDKNLKKVQEALKKGGRVQGVIRND